MGAELSGDEGGEAPCFAHVFDDGEPLSPRILAQLVTELSDAVVVADAEGSIALWNDAATRLFGFAAEEAVGRSLEMIIPERFRERHRAGFHRTMATGETKLRNRVVRVPALRRDGSDLSIALTVTLLHHPGDRRPIGIAAVIRDDTQ